MRRRGRLRVGALLRAWRELRGWNQAELARRAETSTRNLSFIETGRSEPSEPMLERLCHELRVDAHDRTILRRAAGFGPAYETLDLEDAEVKRVSGMLQRMLEAFDPCVAIAIRRRLEPVAMNQSALRFIHFFLDDSPAFRSGVTSIGELVLRDDGLKPYLVNWEHVAKRVLDRMYREVTLDDPDGRMAETYERWLAYPDVRPEWRMPPTTDTDPLLTFRFLRDGLRLDLTSIVTTLGTPMDAHVQELRIRYWAPADPASRAALECLRDTGKADPIPSLAAS
ncbi:MAG: helix-turn-helix transcriptional regulator [Myxococcota bacterium]